MASFAQLDPGNNVINVIRVPDDQLIDENGQENESLGIQFCKQLLGESTIWKQTSFSGSFRKRFAGKGFVYNEEHDAFIPPKLFDNWVLDTEDLCWVPPVPQPEPEEGFYYQWIQEENRWEKYEISSEGGGG